MSPTQNPDHNPDFEVTPAMLETTGDLIDIAGINLRDPAGRPITYMTKGVAQRLGNTFPGALMASLVDTAAEGEPHGWLWETTPPNRYRVWLQSNGTTSTFLLPSEY
jgi:hypothetical protein